MKEFIFLHILLVSVAPNLAEIEMEFTRWPESVTAPIGDNVTFECVVRVPGERLAWRWRPDEESPWVDYREPCESSNVATRLRMEIRDTTEDAYYQCVVWYGAVILVSVPARLNVARIDLSRNVAEKIIITAPTDNTIALHCRPPISEPPALITWFKEVKRKRHEVNSSNGVLVIHHSTIEDTGTYSCTATNELSGQTVDLPEKTFLMVQHEANGDIRFIDDYVGTLDNEGVVTVQVRPNNDLHLWCGVLGTPQPPATWSRDGGPLPSRAKFDEYQLTVSPLKPQDEGIYSCMAGKIRRTWKVMALRAAFWDGSISNVTGTEGGSAKMSCGNPTGQPRPKVYWLLNGQPVDEDKLIKVKGSEIIISRLEKRHASIVQCFACNELGCAYDAALLSVVPKQVSWSKHNEQESMDSGKAHYSSRPSKRHYKKNSRKHSNKAVLVPPSRPNVTRMSDESVMVSWSNGTEGLPILFFKVQYKEAMNSSNSQWNTCNMDISPHIHSYQVNGLIPDRYYKFRISAVYSNQDNQQGRSSGRFYLQSGGFKGPRPPVLFNATALTPTSLLLNWTWSSGNGVSSEGFYVYYRAISSAGEYIKVTAPGGATARSLELTYLTPDTGYEVKVQAYTAQAPSEFSSILTAKTLRAVTSVPTTTLPPPPTPDASGGAMVTVGGAAGAALLTLLAVALLLCRRAKRPHRDKEKVSVPENGGNNRYMPAKVPITITANPMHTEGGENGVEMSFMHNNNTGVEDSTLPHPRKNGSASRQYV